MPFTLSHAAAMPLARSRRLVPAALLGLPVLVLWELVLRRPVVDLARSWLRERLPAPRRPDRAYVLGAVVSVVPGPALAPPRQPGTRARGPAILR